MYQVIESSHHTLHTLTIHCHNGKCMVVAHAHRRPSACTADTTHRAHVQGNATNSLSIHWRDHWLGRWRPPSHAGARDRHHTSTIHRTAHMDGREGTRAHAHTRTSMHEAAAATRQRHGRLVRCMGGALAAGGGRRGRHGRWVAVAQQRVDEVVWRLNGAK